MSTWVIGDIHGCYRTFLTLLRNKEIKDEDTIILIGDIIDRGKESYAMLHWAMKHITDDGKYQMILGNHEDNIIRDYQHISETCAKYYPMVASIEEMDIGKLNCHYGFDWYMYDKGYETVGSIRPFIEWFKTLPLYKEIDIKDNEGNTIHYVIAHAWYEKGMSRDDILWYRDLTSKDCLDEKDYQGEGILIHGHTPTLCIKDCIKKPKNEVLFRDKSINIDCGCVFQRYGGNLAAIRLEDKKVIYARKQQKIKN